ncbi:glutathione peroxidase [Marinospirillum celere]|uniref:Glutathione peroxidase n=1 Tax=Marinospirillum celere TaxID=1122252 RepID=A0A1I1EM59_9GAMM|nr:glutathione peroxidase [Marinospirillum celere]SFB88184.1 glutathione peroxidase [Marinospirillum celere]
MPVLILLLALMVTSPLLAAETKTCPAILSSTQPKLHSGESVDLCEFAGKPLLIVNTASHCGYTGQFEGLEKLHQRYQDQGLVVLGFPSNDFRQEASDEAKTAEVCFINYGVTFTMLSPTAVARGDLNPVFSELSNQGAGLPRWNFYKYLVNRDGELVTSFGSRTRPESQAMQEALEKLL